MFSRLKNNKQGIVLVTVVMIIVVMVVIAVGVIGMNLNQVMLTETEIKNLKRDALMQGAWGYSYTSMNNNPTNSTVNLPQAPTLNNSTFAWTVDPLSMGQGINQTANVVIHVNY